MIETFIDISLLTLLAITAISIVYMRNILSVIMLSSIYSLVSATFFVVLDAVDVAFTEAAVGAGITTVLFLAALALTGKDQPITRRNTFAGLFAVLLTSVVLVYGVSEMPPFGDPDAPINHHVAPRYLQQSEQEIGIPNVVTSVLASYRGFDTFGEVTVVFTALVGVLLLLLRRPGS